MEKAITEFNKNLIALLKLLEKYFPADPMASRLKNRVILVKGSERDLVLVKGGYFLAKYQEFIIDRREEILEDLLTYIEELKDLQFDDESEIEIMRWVLDKIPAAYKSKEQTEKDEIYNHLLNMTTAVLEFVLAGGQLEKPLLPIAKPASKPQAIPAKKPFSLFSRTPKA